jgi:transcription antitermination factor NusG
MPGRVYVEAQSRDDVVAAFPHARWIFRVSFEESINLIQWIDRIRSNQLQKGTWVRFRRGHLKNTLGIVVETRIGTDSTTIATLSHQRADPTATGKETDRELCKRQIQAAHAVTIVPHPPMEEVLLFYTSGSLEFASIVKEALHKESVRTSWQTGDRVKVLSGAFITSEGRLKSLDLELWSAEVELQEGGGLASIPLDELERHFFVGDEVLVIAGVCKGRHGIVVSLDNEGVVFIEDKTREEVRLFSADTNALLERSSPQVKAWNLFLRSYSPDYTFSSTPLPLQLITGRRSEHPLTGKRVLVIGRSAYKGLFGEIRAPAREGFLVAVGQPARFVIFSRSQLVLL